MRTENYHIPVLFNETIDALNIKKDGIYVDCTFGGGGHSRGILEKLGSGGKLIAFDQDANAANNLPADERIIFVQENFRYLSRFLKLYKIEKVDGILADLGVSSHQFDEGERGFSTRFEGPLDMRMDQRNQASAEDIIRTYSEEKLHRLFEKYGEVSNSKTLARQIVEQRRLVPFQTILQFKSLISAVVKGNPNKYLAQVFQALRIEVNDELGALEEMLEQVPSILNKGGRLAIISFHSLEDKLIKNFLKNGNFIETDEHPFESQKREMQFSVITKKPITASEDELKKNPRSRSAKLRIGEKL